MKLTLALCCVLLLSACDGHGNIHFPDGTRVQTGGRYYDDGGHHHKGKYKCPPGHHMKGEC